jgi:hypothetical protein
MSRFFDVLGRGVALVVATRCPRSLGVSPILEELLAATDTTLHEALGERQLAAFT